MSNTVYTSRMPEKGHLPLLAIDLGYSAQSRSCGLAYTGGGEAVELTFGECVKQTCVILNNHGPHILILEAVLSTYHNELGNPEIRGEFERGRGWYYGPGVTTLAAAMRLLNEIAKSTSFNEPIPIVEGMLTFKKQRTGHGADAAILLTHFYEAPIMELAVGCEPLLPLIAGIPQVRAYHLVDK